MAALATKPETKRKSEVELRADEPSETPQSLGALAGLPLFLGGNGSGGNSVAAPEAASPVAIAPVVTPQPAAALSIPESAPPAEGPRPAPAPKGAEAPHGEAAAHPNPGETKAAASPAAPVQLLMPEPPAGLSPANKARIHHVQAGASHNATIHATLPPADATVGEARAAVTEPPQETSAHAQEKLATTLRQKPKPSPMIEVLCFRIFWIIRSKRPPDEDKLVDADPEAMGKAAGGAMNQTVQQDTQHVDTSFSPLQTDPKGKPEQVGKGMNSPPETVASAPMHASQAAPDAVPAKNVSLDADVASSQKRMDDAGMNKEPAKLAQTGPVAEAREAHGELEKTAQEDPAKVMAKQKAALDKASGDMAALQRSTLAALTASRKSTVGQSTGHQKQMVGTEQEKRATASRAAQDIFKQAKSDVQTQLNGLKKTAMENWDAGVEKASQTFKDHLKTVDERIRKRHHGIGGKLLGALDWATGLPGWVTDLYDEAEREFGDNVCKLAREISTQVNGVIMACEEIIENARNDIHGVFTGLGGELKEWAAGEEKQFGTQLDGLHKEAIQTRDDFNKELISKASQSVQEVREQIHELREAAKGLIGRIADAIGRFLDDPVKFIIEAILHILGIPVAAFWAVVAKIKKVIGQIADDPLGFASNLLSAVGQGFSLFFDHILDHLLRGFINWLTGGLASAGVEIPKDTSTKSILIFVLQLMGINWPRIRKLLIKHVGEKNVVLVEKVWSLISNLIALGPEGVFEMVRERLNPIEIISQIIHAAVNYLEEAVIKAVSVRIVMLFNPVGAILEALEAIYRVLKWIFVNAARIFHLVEVIVDGVADIIAGNIGGMARAIESALALLIPPVIDFLADYLGFGDLPEKVHDTILGFQDWVEGLLDQAIGWLVEKGKGLLAAVGIGGEEKPNDKRDPDAGQIGKDVAWSVDGEQHHLWIEVKAGSARALMASGSPAPVLAALDVYETKAAALADEDSDTSKDVTKLVGTARKLVRDLDSASDKMAKAAAKADESGAPPKDVQAQEAAIEEKEDELRTIVKDIQSKLGLNDEADIKKARAKFKLDPFSTDEDLAPLLNVSTRTAQRRVGKWKEDGILFRFESHPKDPLGLCTFDPVDAKLRETNPNNRFKYGYVNPKKTDSEGLKILSKGLRDDSPVPKKLTARRFGSLPADEKKDLREDAKFHKDYARYDSKRGAQDFDFDVAILGHHVDYGASDHWNDEGHTKTRDFNMDWNQNPANYDGPEHEDESAASGGSSARYKVPSRAYKPPSNECWFQ